MLAFPVAGAVLASSPAAQTSDTAGDHGATPSISANGDQNGIVWIVSVEDAGKLRAYDARDLTRIYDSNAQPADALYNYAEFVAPTIADGKVYVGTFYGVAVYGQTGAAQAVINAVTNAASYATDALSPGSLITLFGTDLAPVTARARATPTLLHLRAPTSCTRAWPGVRSTHCSPTPATAWVEASSNSLRGARHFHSPGRSRDFH